MRNYISGITDKIKKLVREGCRRDISLDRMLEIRTELQRLRRLKKRNERIINEWFVSKVK